MITTRQRPPQLTSRARGTYRDDHGSPLWVFELHRRLCGKTDWDLASTPGDNALLGARRFYSELEPCPELPHRVAEGSCVYCNPPGPGALVQRFWRTWLWLVEERCCTGTFLAFSADHMRQFTPPTKLALWVGIPRSRLHFRGNAHGASWVSALITTEQPRDQESLERCLWMLWGS